MKESGNNMYVIACIYRTIHGNCKLDHKPCNGCEDVFPAFYNPEEFLDEDEKEGAENDNVF